MSYNTFLFDYLKSPKSNRDDYDLIGDIVSIKITPLSTYIWDKMPRKDWNPENDFPSITSPWPYCWIEYKVSKRMYHLRGTKAMGCLIHSYPVPEEEREEYVRRDELNFRLNASFPPQYRQAKIEPERQEAINRVLDSGRSCHWLQFFQFVRLSTTGQIEMICYAAHCLDKDGRTIFDLSLGTDGREDSKGNNTGIPYDHLGTVMIHIPFYYALSLLHCKNVEIVDEEIPEKVKAKRDKKKEPQVIYKTLKIDPMVQKIVHTGTHNEDTVKKRLHICRGHFADYREGGGLFGKQHGLFWVPMHVRGDRKIGVVIKDYEIQAEQDKELSIFD